MLQEFTHWFLDLVGKVFVGFWSFFVDALINIFELFLSAVVGLINLLPAPAWLQGGLGNFYNMLDPGILFILNSVGLPAAFGMIGGAYVFRMSRKVLTLFQW